METEPLDSEKLISFLCYFHKMLDLKIGVRQRLVKYQKVLILSECFLLVLIS